MMAFDARRRKSQIVIWQQTFLALLFLISTGMKLGGQQRQEQEYRCKMEIIIKMLKSESTKRTLRYIYVIYKYTNEMIKPMVMCFLELIFVNIYVLLICILVMAS